MQVIDAVRTILAVREYDKRPIEASTLRTIVEAGHLSASARNRQPWHFVVVDDRSDLERLGQRAKTGPYIAGARAAIVVLIEKESRWAESDASRAIQNMLLTAWELGIGSNWVGFYGLDEIGAYVGAVESQTVLAVLPLGYPAQSIGKGEKARKPFDEVVSYGKVGVPFH